MILSFWWRVLLLRWTAWAVAGFLWAWFHGYVLLGERLPADWEGRDLVVEGRIASIPTTANWGGKKFDLDTLKITVDGAVLPLQRGLRLSWSSHEVPNLIVGELWRLTVRLKRPHGTMSPGCFDQEGGMFQNGIQGVGSVRADPPAVRLDEGSWRYIVNRVRQILALDIAQARPDSPYLGVLQGLAIGETSAVTHEQWDVLVRTGTIHLLAISGSHIRGAHGAKRSATSPA